MVPPENDVAMLSGDPIQNLFTILRNIHNLLNKVQHMPNKGDWCDECMEELMAGLEISMACDWPPIKSALIDAARILHSYEQAGKAELCIPFLKEGYEILSLMGGDLILDKVGPGARKLWHDHYKKAVATLDAEGIELVEDETAEADGGGSVGAVSKQEVVTEDVDDTVEFPTSQTEVTPEEMVSAFDDASSIGDDIETAVDETDEQEPPPPFDLPPLSEEGMDRKKEHAMEQDDSSIISFPDAAPEGTASFEMGTPSADESNGQAAPNESSEEDAFFLSNETETQTPDAPQQQADAETEMPSVALDHGDATAASETEAPVSEPEEARAEKNLSDEGASQEAHQALAGDTAAVETAPEELSPVSTPFGESPSAVEELLTQARTAMSKGDIRYAKSAALALAVAMAKLEYEQAQAQLAAAEQRLVDNARDIENAELTVDRTERDLLQAEELLAAREGECTACRSRIGTIDEELTVLSSELADIDEQIALLQQRRQEQVNRIENKQEEREEFIGGESRMQTEMEELGQETEAVRTALEEARANTRRKIDERRAIELEIHETREEAAVRQASLTAIERTLDVGEALKSEDAPDGDSLL